MRGASFSASSPSTRSRERRTTAYSVASEASSADLQRLTVTVAADAAERARGELAELVPTGWCEREGTDGYVAFELWVPAADASAAVRLGRDLARRDLAARVAAAREGDEWRDGLRRLNHPVEIAGRLRVRPPWVAPLPGLIDVVIDPGMAFGTGQHGTTRACLELLLDVPPGSLLDAGCGSGVLAIASRKLGHDPVSAVDTDPLAVEAARRNARDNAVTVDIALGDGGSPPPAVDTIVANIACRQVAALGARLGAPPRHAILSGLRPGEAREATAPWRRIGLTDVRTIESDGWTTVAMTRG